MLSPSRSGVISFGSFQLDPETGSLEKHGVRVRLPRQPARILKILAQRAGEVVTREELRDELWGSDTFVDFEHGLNAAINKLRQVLGDSAEKPRFIETLPGQGYRFVAAVRVEAPETCPRSDAAGRSGNSAAPESATLAAAAGVRRCEPRVPGCGSTPGAPRTAGASAASGEVRDLSAERLCLPACRRTPGICRLSGWIASRVHDDRRRRPVPSLDSPSDQSRRPGGAGGSRRADLVLVAGRRRPVLQRGP